MRIRKQYLLEKYDLTEGIGSQVMAGLATAAMGVMGSGDASNQQKNAPNKANVQQSTQQNQAKPSGTFYDDDIKNLSTKFSIFLQMLWL